MQARLKDLERKVQIELRIVEAAKRLSEVKSGTKQAKQQRRDSHQKALAQLFHAQQALEKHRRLV
jgi:hypothetical protein